MNKTPFTKFTEALRDQLHSAFDETAEDKLEKFGVLDRSPRPESVTITDMDTGESKISTLHYADEYDSIEEMFEKLAPQGKTTRTKARRSDWR